MEYLACPMCGVMLCSTRYCEVDAFDLWAQKERGGVVPKLGASWSDSWAWLQWLCLEENLFAEPEDTGS
jgi:hypothetical protein